MASTIPAAAGTLARRKWLVTGQVQGVGFRPHVYRVACDLGLVGFVRNGKEGVTIETQGLPHLIARFAIELRETAPSLCRIREFAGEDIAVVDGEHEFRILRSDGTTGELITDITIDSAVCAHCRNELLATTDRRRGHGLINCTQCGPRYTIARSVPYDRHNTTMSTFPMCVKCRTEYEDPANRRFHAQPIACNDCGPKVVFADVNGVGMRGDPYVFAVDALASGKIIAIKGLGGFHLACRADQASSVDRLRQLKHRDAKPFAIMCRDLEHARELVNLGTRAVEVMQSPSSPIVLARRRSAKDAGALVADSVAPRSHRLGVMLPYTPIHHMLFATGASKLPALVMTSANGCDEPLVIDDKDAIERLGRMCDGFLWHDRPIARGVDDSVMLDIGGEEDLIPIRRARGYVPEPIELATNGTSGICLGAELKSTVAVVRHGSATLSQHIGDLTHPRTYHAFRKAIEDLIQLFDIKPAWIAHDLHPMYLSTAHAKQLNESLGVPLLGIQHHHAHIASCMAEHGVKGPVLAVVCDGTGYGTDGAIWGGELMYADYLHFRRLAHLRPLPLPGGDAAAKDPRRSALSLLHQALGDDFVKHPALKSVLANPSERDMLANMLTKNVNCALSSGAGRVFDGVASLLGVCHENHFEAQAAMALEAAAEGGVSPKHELLAELHSGKPTEIDLSPLIRQLLHEQAKHRPAAELAAMFHDQFVGIWDAIVAKAATKTGVKSVALTGGVFCNAIVTRRLTRLLQQRGLTVLRHRIVPPNDGGISLGQAAIASARAAAGMLQTGVPSCA